MSADKVTQSEAEWQRLDRVPPPKNGRWIVFADMDDAGIIHLAHVDVAVVELDVWYVGCDLSMWTHWRYLNAASDVVTSEASQ